MTWTDYKERIGRRRILLTTESGTDLEAAKTATGVLLFCGEEVVGVLDSRNGGRTVCDVFGLDLAIPVLASVSDAMPLGPTELVIGVATPGGVLSGEIRRQVVEAMDAGLDIVNGLHMLLRDDDELRDRARDRGVRLFDIREPAGNVPLGANRAKDLAATRVLTVGSDCNVGKMFASLKLVAELKRRGHAAEFVPTGQTGILVAGWGVSVDRVIADFISGAAEWLVSQPADSDIRVVEGQGAITHPSFSGVSLGLLHGTAPDAMILCHRAGRTVHRHTDCPIPPLRWIMETHERLAAAIHPCRVVGIALNSGSLSADERADLCGRLRTQTNLPVVDPGVESVAPLADAVEAVHRVQAKLSP